MPGRSHRGTAMEQILEPECGVSNEASAVLVFTGLDEVLASLEALHAG